MVSSVCSLVDPTVALWEVANEDSDANQSSLSDASSNEGFLAEADFASAVAKAAQGCFFSGLTVIGSTVIDPNSGREREKGQLISKYVLIIIQIF